MTTNLAIAYIERLALSRDSWQIYESWLSEQEHWAVLAQWSPGFELQSLICVDGSNVPVRWIPLRIFESPGGRDSDFRGCCVWFNPAEVEASVMEEHNRSTRDQQTLFSIPLP